MIRDVIRCTWCQTEFSIYIHYNHYYYCYCHYQLIPTRSLSLPLFLRFCFLFFFQFHSFVYSCIKYMFINPVPVSYFDNEMKRQSNHFFVRKSGKLLIIRTIDAIEQHKYTLYTHTHTMPTINQDNFQFDPHTT